MIEVVKKILFILALLLCPLSGLGQTGAIQGTSTLGGISATTQGAQSSNKLLGVIPAAKISIYLTGTQTLAILTSDGTHSLSNPFYSNASNAVNPGGYIAFAALDTGYDIVASSGQGTPNCTTGPLCYTQPVTLCKDCYPSSQIVIPTAGCIGQNAIANGCTGATTAAGAAANIVNGQPISPSSVTTGTVVAGKVNASVNSAINVSSPPYNADPTGTIPSTPSTGICAAATAAQNGAATISFAAGTYTVNGTCSVTSNFAVTATGPVTITQLNATAYTFSDSGAQFLSVDGGASLITFAGGLGVVHVDNNDIDSTKYNFRHLIFGSGIASYAVDVQNTRSATPISFTGTLTSGSTTIASVSSTAGLPSYQGYPIVGTGVPLGAVISYVGSGFITITLPATASAPGVALNAYAALSYNQMSAIVTFDDITFNSSFAFKTIADQVIVKDSRASWTPTENNVAFMYIGGGADPNNSGKLVIENSTFVPYASGFTNVRWIDDYGSVLIEGHSRFSCENGGGYPTIYSFTPYDNDSSGLFAGSSTAAYDSTICVGSNADQGFVVIPPYGNLPGLIKVDSMPLMGYPYINNQAGATVGGTQTLAAYLAGAAYPMYTFRTVIGSVIPANLVAPPNMQGSVLLYPTELIPYTVDIHDQNRITPPQANATSGTNYTSFITQMAASYWTGSVAALDTYSWQNICASGTNPVCTLTLSTGGSSGGHAVSLGVPVSGQNFNNVDMWTNYTSLYVGSLYNSAAATWGSSVAAFGNNAFAYGGAGLNRSTAFGYSAGQFASGGVTHVTGPQLSDYYGYNVEPSSATPYNEIAFGSNSVGHGDYTATWGNESITYHYFHGAIIPTLLYSAGGTPLPTCAAGNVGASTTVSDANTPTYMGAYTSGGTITAAVICSYSGSAYAWRTH